MIASSSLGKIGSRLRILSLISLTSILAACGGDGSKIIPTPVEETPAEVVENTVTGSVIKGPVNGSVVMVYEFDGVTEIGRGETDSDGSFSITIGDSTGGVLISATGGTYTDEATGAENVQFGAVEMRAAYMIPESMTPPFDATINVTPFTELTVREAFINGAIDAQILAGAIDDFFDLGDNAINILTTLPTNPLTDSVNEGTPEDLYGLFLAMISQMVDDQSLGSWDEVINLLEMTEDMSEENNVLISTALNALAQSDSAAGANITLDAVTAVLEVLGVVSGDPTNDGQEPAGGGTDDSDASGGGSAGSGAMPCLAGTGEPASIPSGLAGTVGDLTLTFAAAGSNLTEGVVQNFTFSSSGSLFIDNHLIAGSLYTCGGTSELFWYEELMDRVYSVSFTSEGSFNEVNLNSGDGTFLGQYTDENGDFANVTN